MSLTTTEFLSFTANISGATFTSVANVTNTTQFGAVEDNNGNDQVDFSGGGTNNDGFVTGGNEAPFSGYTTIINGNEYAIFQSGPNFVIPHLGELSVSDIANPLTVTFNIAAVSVQNCFLAGTAVRGATGDKAIEDLRPGDTILTASGAEVPVKWLGVQTVSTRFGPAERVMPVRIRAGALGDGLPLRDLTLTADHALLIDGLLINAGALVNGTTIDWVPLGEFGDGYTVYHVETEDHDIILAEGMPAETFIDYVGRAAFDNHAEYLDLYGAERIIPEMAHLRISTQRLLPEAIRARLGIGGAGADRDLRLTG